MATNYKRSHGLGAFYRCPDNKHEWTIAGQNLLTGDDILECVRCGEVYGE